MMLPLKCTGDIINILLYLDIMMIVVFHSCMERVFCSEIRLAVCLV